MVDSGSVDHMTRRLIEVSFIGERGGKESLIDYDLGTRITGVVTSGEDIEWMLWESIL